MHAIHEAPENVAITIKPPALRPGDTIGVIAPSAPGPALFPHVVQRGMSFLESLGYRVVPAPHLFGQSGYVSGTPQERADDLHTLFADDQIRAIWCAIGGDHSCHMLPYLDWELIRANPKIFVGWSDGTVLNLAIHARTGLITFYGPPLMVDLAEFPNPAAYTISCLRRVLERSAPPGPIDPAAEWTEEYTDWDTTEGQIRRRRWAPSAGWTWLKLGTTEGTLIGGCLESMQHLRGTPYWPTMRDAILFFETSEEMPPPEWVDGVLQDYENMGVLDEVRGLLIGRPYGYSAEQKELLRRIILERTARYDFPIVTDMDFGHTSPQMTLPVGGWASIDVAQQRFSLVQAAVE
jgi:muramoyltetrapeptide carboxypeptidase